jgi:predicted HD phosphohydrolase
MTSDELRSILASLAGVVDGEEPLDELSHAVQCALLAQAAGADGELITAALFHDVARSPLVSQVFPDMTHEVAGAAWLRPRFGDRVAWIVSAHAAAKIYLMDHEPEYSERLSEESRRSAVAQRKTSLELFVSNPWWMDALELRRWDDAAKDPTFCLPDVNGLLAIVESVRLA